jgi:U3 small nucleolar RNA-associated protein 19
MPVSSLPPTKKRKTVVQTTSIKSLEAQLTSAVADNGSLNPLADLLVLAHGTSDAREMSKAIYSIYRVFVLIISRGMLVHGGDDAAKLVRKWIWEKLDSFVELLAGLLQDDEPSLRVRITQSVLACILTSMLEIFPGDPFFAFEAPLNLINQVLSGCTTANSHTTLQTHSTRAPAMPSISSVGSKK